MMLLAIDFENLHQILRNLYQEMMPLCGDIIGIAKGIAGLGALFYVASRVWQALSRAEPIDVYPLLRPFATVYPTRLCACSRTAGSWLYGEKPFRVFNNAIELDRFTYDAAKRKAVRQELGLGDELVLGHVGRFCYAKNHEFLLDVMAEVCKQRPDAVLLLIGEGENEAASRRKAEALGLQENVRFLGRQSDPAKFYQAMDAFVLPSRYEGLGIVLIEAQAAALPVICSTEVPQEAQVLPEMQYLSLQESPAVWADAAIRAAENARRRDTSAEMRAGGFDIVTEAKKLEAFYFDLLK